MSAQLFMDPLDFARNGGTHHGKIALSGLERLQDYLTDNSGEVQYAVTGALNRNAKPMLQIVVRGLISLCCQRCLGKYPHALDLQADLLLARDENELARLDEDESVDCILATANMDILALIEDEIILSLPLSPRHGESECSIDRPDSDTAKEKPIFAALAALKNLH
ncbi:YceD family protein [Nitrosospira briensis]|uniref:YceD family protein n=1 Tax=Nitrosospira briensis TaxID=35799 RepID=UPI0008EC957F|nr:YceD family protein [Nitrosospira briensis]SFO01747.1 uncharacterized protein SAMN05216332_103216 [Nitrosospira briensis]